MRPEYYADLYRRYQTYCRNFSGNELYKIASGPNVDDYNWTDTIMGIIGDWHAKAISLHYYTIPSGDFANKGSAVDFTDEVYYKTISQARRIERLIDKHAAIMKKYSDNMKLAVDEWGCWFDVEEGTNPGFLYQQNTMRDAMVAAVSLNIFNSRSDIVSMANIAQAVNVLQAVILTEGEKLVKTPTYHIFDMYKTHQDSELVYSFTENFDTNGMPAVSQSVSVGKEGMTLTFANASLDEGAHIDCSILGFKAQNAEARILTGEVHTFNDFADGDRIAPAAHAVDITDSGISFELPPCSVVSILLS